MINIVDNYPGSGKTTWAINFINEDEKRKILYITPFLTEVKRIKENCKYFDEPSGYPNTKIESLRKLLEKGCRIVSTHALFSIIDKQCIDYIKEQEYTLILDEAFNVLFDVMLSKWDINLLLNSDLIYRDGYYIKWNENKFINYEGLFSDLRQMARYDRLIVTDSGDVFWKMPLEVFSIFQDIYVLTYMFSGQLQKYYYDMHELEYKIYSVYNIKNKYELCTFSYELDSIYRDKLRKKIHIYNGKLNDVGEDRTNLSVSWYEGLTTEQLKNLSNVMYNYVHNIAKCKGEDLLWTTFLEYKKSIERGGYKTSFAVHNIRATNMFRKKTVVAYLVNRYMKPDLVKYFTKEGLSVNQDDYALSEMLQFLFRSAIRDNNDVRFFIPSYRMRNLLIDWLEFYL